MKAPWRSERASGEGTRFQKLLIEKVAGWRSRASWENGRDAIDPFARYADPEIESQRLREVRAEVASDRLRCEAAHEFIDEEAKGAWMIAMASVGTPMRRLCCQRRDNAPVIPY